MCKACASQTQRVETVVFGEGRLAALDHIPSVSLSLFSFSRSPFSKIPWAPVLSSSSIMCRGHWSFLLNFHSSILSPPPLSPLWRGMIFFYLPTRWMAGAWLPCCCGIYIYIDKPTDHTGIYQINSWFCEWVWTPLKGVVMLCVSHPEKS